jgi:hypothetical protein
VSDDDRSTILRRRAFFVTSAVAAFGACARTPPAEPASPAPVVSVPLAVEDAGEPPEDAATPVRDASPSTEGPPPLVIPDGVSDTARGNYERLVRTMTRAYGVLDEIDAAIPSCPILSPKCVPRWRDVAEKLHELDGMFQRRTSSTTTSAAPASSKSSMPGSRRAVTPPGPAGRSSSATPSRLRRIRASSSPVRTGDRDSDKLS